MTYSPGHTVPNDLRVTEYQANNSKTDFYITECRRRMRFISPIDGRQARFGVEVEPPQCRGMTISTSLMSHNFTTSAAFPRLESDTSSSKPDADTIKRAGSIVGTECVAG